MAPKDPIFMAIPRRMKETGGPMAQEVLDPVSMRTPPQGQTQATETAPQVLKERTMAMIDPSEWNLENAQDLTILPEGSEINFRILSVRKGAYGEEGGQTEYWQPTLEVVGEPNIKDFTHFLNVPNRKGQTEKQYQQSTYALRVFMECLGQSLSEPFDPMQDWPGMDGWAILSIKESAEYGKQNYIKITGFVRH